MSGAFKADTVFDDDGIADSHVLHSSLIMSRLGRRVDATEPDNGRDSPTLRDRLLYNDRDVA